VIETGPECGPHEGCITCGDEAHPMRVRKLDEARGLALCEAADGSKNTVEVALVPHANVGEVLLVHAGAALALLTDPHATAEVPA